MNARLHDSVARTAEVRNEFEERLRADGLLLRKLVMLVNRGAWTAYPNTEAWGGGFIGKTPEDLEAFRKALDSAGVVTGRFACV